MICIMDENNVCQNRHKGMVHNAHYRQYALDPGEKGERFRKLWDGIKDGTHIAPPLRDGRVNMLRSIHVARQCRHLGTRLTWDEGKLFNEELLKLGVKQPTCNGKRHEFHCSVRKFTNQGHCMNCTDYKPTPYHYPQSRHLIYHIYPVASNGRWQWNVEQLCGRLKAFNGEIIIAVCIDPPTGRKSDPTGPFPPDGGRYIPGCDTLDMVKKEFQKRFLEYDRIKFLEFENDPNLREVKPLIPMLEMLPHDDPHSITLYGQAKGVTRRTGHIAEKWTEAIYEIYMDHFPLAEEQLMEFPVTGAFKKLGPGWSPIQSKSDWHYSGSWFWFRNAELFKRDWRKIDQFWSGIEPYPSQQFFATEAGCMFLEAQVPQLNLYSHRYWYTTVTPALDRFRQEKANYRTTLWPK